VDTVAIVEAEGARAIPIPEPGGTTTPIGTGTTGKPTGEIIMLNIKVVTWSLAIFVTIAYLSCIAFGLITPDSLHMTGFLEQVLPGFRWLTLTGFLVGLIEAFLYGVYTGMVFVPVYNTMWKKLGTP
jgi:2TM family of unknown function (DUF5676)